MDARDSWFLLRNRQISSLACDSLNSKYLSAVVVQLALLNWVINKQCFGIQEVHSFGLVSLLSTCMLQCFSETPMGSVEDT